MPELNPKRALLIVAHPDDAEYFCGGLVAKWSEHGTVISYLVTSSGDKGSNDLHADIEQLVATREAEQRASAELLGVSDVTFLRYPDSELSFVDQKQLRGEYVRHIRRTQAEVVVTHDPFVRTIRQHADHRAVGRLTLDAAYPISTVAQCYREQILHEGLSPWQASTVLLFGTDQPNYGIDISTRLALKVEAIQTHGSQMSAFGGVESRVPRKAQIIGERYGFEAAEEFLRIQLGPTLPT